MKTGQVKIRIVPDFLTDFERWFEFTRAKAEYEVAIEKATRRFKAATASAKKLTELTGVAKLAAQQFAQACGRMARVDWRA